MLIDHLLLSDRTGGILKKNLDFLSERSLLINGNITNMDTPGYKAKDMDFQKQLQESIDLADKLSVKTTNGKHIGPGRDTVDNMQPQVFETENAAKSNGNNVDLDNEMMKLAETQIMYNTVVQLIGKRGVAVETAISGNITR
jgi:flagellar basal-body rod protein FlgB